MENINSENSRRILSLYGLESKTQGFDLEEIKKNFLLSNNELEKSKSGLVKKRVSITSKDGKVHYAIRWVKPDTDNSPDLEHNRYRKTGDMTKPEEEQIQEVVNDSSLKTQEKFRKLAGLGIYDKKILATLSGHKYPGDIKEALRKEVELDTDDYGETINTDLPSTPSTNPTLDSTEVQRMAISEIQEKLGNKAAFEKQMSLKLELIQKYNLTVNDKWDSYEKRLETLIVNRYPKAVMAYGTGGIGKTYTFEKLCDKHGLIEYDDELGLELNGSDYDFVKISGKSGSRVVQRNMFEHSNKLIVFDDCDSIWNDEDIINVLKGALDTSGDNKVQWAQALPETVKGKGDNVPSRFRFTGRMLFITNLSKKELSDKGASPVTESRASSIDLTMTAEQAIERLESILPGVKLKDDSKSIIEVTEEDKKVSLEVMKELKEFARIEQINNRVLSTLIMEAKRQREIDGNYDNRMLEIFLLQQYGII